MIRATTAAVPPSMAATDPEPLARERWRVQKKARRASQ